MNQVKTAVIPVAGLGTRLLPASKSIPKEMVPVVDKPIIQHVVEEAVEAGITRIVLVTRSGKESIENHFDRLPELEAELERKGKTQLLRAVRDIVPNTVEILSVRQPRAAGLGDAIRCAAGIVGREPFAVMLPDVLVHSRFGKSRNLRTMIDCFEKSLAAQILVERVPRDAVENYGVVDCGRKDLVPGKFARVFGLVEKPPRDQAPSNLAIVGRYVLPPRVMQLLMATDPGAGGEVQLTDALQALVGRSLVQALMMRGRSFDCGNKSGFLQANIALGLEDRDIADELAQFIADAYRRFTPLSDLNLSEVA